MSWTGDGRFADGRAWCHCYDWGLLYERYNACFEVDPSFVDAYVDFAGLLVKVGDFRVAHQVLEEASKLEPDDLLILTNLEIVLLQLHSSGPEYKEKLKTVRSSLKELKGKGRKLPVLNWW